MATVATISVNFAQYNATSFNAPGVIDRSINPSTLSQYCLGSSTPDFNYLGGFVKKTADTMSGYLTLPSTNPTLPDHATRKGYVDSRIDSLSSTVSDSGNGFVKIKGSTMTGGLILNTSSPVLPLQASSKGYVDARVNSLSSTVDSKLAGEFLAKAGGTMSGIINMGSQKITFLANPVVATDAANKTYVDNAISTATAGGASVAYVNQQDALNVLKTGSHMTGPLTIAGSEGSIGSNGGGSGAHIDVQSKGLGATSNAAYMTFHRPGEWAVKFGLDTDKKLKVGGWSLGNVAYEILNQNNWGTYIQPAINVASAAAAAAQGTANTAVANAATAQTAANNANASANNRVLKTGDTMSGHLTIQNGSPTLYLQDTDHQSAMIHCNNHLLYFLRGATNSTTWAQINGQWPLYLNLTNNDAVFGGAIVAVGDITAFSDERIKENIKTIEEPLDKVLKMRGVSYNRSDEYGEKGRLHVGVIAQEIEKILPEVVSENDKGMKTVAYGNIVGVLIEAIKELNAKIEKLEAKN